MAEPLPVDIVSDVVCPWCYVGKRHLEKALALKPEIPVELRFRPYFLNPWVPRDGMSRDEYLIAKFGSVERYNANNQRVADAAEHAGLPYAREKIKRQPNTLDCHRLIRWAGEDGPKMKQRLMALYFAEGGDLSDREVLVGAAKDCGMVPDEVRARLAGDQDIADVSAEAERAKQAGIDGVPCFIFGGLIAVSGAQPPEYLVQALERAVSERERRVAAK
jgi:predicted DsbA family dithiol-disulfide isomerase